MNDSISRNSVVVASDHQVSSDFVDDEIIVLDVHEGTYYVLNPVGARIWSLIQTPKPVAELIDTLLDEYAVTEDRCVREVTDLLSDLATRKLIEVKDGAA